MIQVIRVRGHARFSALTTGRTWTASPSALSMTISTSRGGSANRTCLDMERGFESFVMRLGYDASTLRFPFRQRAHEPLAHHLGAVPGRFLHDRAPIQIEHIRAVRRNQDVFQIEI